MNNFAQGPLEIKIEKEKDKAVMVWSGSSIDRAPSVRLTPYLKSVVQGLDGCKLILEFSTLKFMNSSTVKSIIAFINELNAHGINTTVRYDKDSEWQATSFKALEVILKFMNHIAIEGK